MSRHKLILLLAAGIIVVAILAMLILLIILTNLVGTPVPNRNTQTLQVVQIENDGTNPKSFRNATTKLGAGQAGRSSLDLPQIV